MFTCIALSLHERGGAASRGYLEPDFDVPRDINSTGPGARACGGCLFWGGFLGLYYCTAAGGQPPMVGCSAAVRATLRAFPRLPYQSPLVRTDGRLCPLAPAGIDFVLRRGARARRTLRVELKACGTPQGR